MIDEPSPHQTMGDRVSALVRTWLNGPPMTPVLSVASGSAIEQERIDKWKGRLRYDAARVRESFPDMPRRVIKILALVEADIMPHYVAPEYLEQVKVLAVS